MIKLIVFDLDGTLVNAYKAVALSLNKVLSDFRLPSADDNTIQRAVGWGERLLLGKFIPSDKLDEGIDLYRKYHGEALPHETFFLPNAKKLLDDLISQGYVLAIATNRPVWSTCIILKCLNIAEYFAVVLSGEEVARQKPSSDVLVEILKRLDISSDESLYVGDMIIDAKTGSSANVKTVIVTTGSSSREEIEAESPFKVVENVYDVIDIVNILNQNLR